MMFRKLRKKKNVFTYSNVAYLIYYGILQKKHYSNEGEIMFINNEILKLTFSKSNLFSHALNTSLPEPSRFSFKHSTSSSLIFEYKLYSNPISGVSSWLWSPSQPCRWAAITLTFCCYNTILVHQMICAWIRGVRTLTPHLFTAGIRARTTITRGQDRHKLFSVVRRIYLFIVLPRNPYTGVIQWIQEQSSNT